MKTQIVRLSPHQNAKVLAVYAALFSFAFVIVIAIAVAVARPLDRYGDPVEFPIYLFLLLPVLYFVFGYIFIAAICALYNLGYRLIGGIEFELEAPQPAREAA